MSFKKTCWNQNVEAEFLNENTHRIYIENVLVGVVDDCIVLVIYICCMFCVGYLWTNFTKFSVLCFDTLIFDKN